MPNKRAASDIDRHVAERIREGREAANLTQQMVAAQVGVSFQQFQKYESGANRITAGRLFALGAALGVPITYFFDGLSAAAARPSGKRRRKSRVRAAK